MSSLINPQHPGVIFTQKKLGQTFLGSAQFIMPPASALTFVLTPPSGNIWVLAAGSSSPVRDVATGNAIVSPLLTSYFRHSMLRGAIQYPGLDSAYNFPWPMQLDLKVNDPLVGTAINGTGLTVEFNVTFAVMEITEDKYDQYSRLWNGLYNFEMLLGSLSDFDIEGIVSLLRALKPAVSAPTPEPTLEVVSHPSMAEDTGKTVKRIEIP